MTRWLLSIVFLFVLWPVESADVAGTITAGPQILTPYAHRTFSIALTTKRALHSLVLQVHIRGAIDAAPNDDGACQGIGQDERGETQEGYCTWLDVPEGTTITRTLTFAPIRVITDPISAACATPLIVGYPFSLSADGQEIIYRQTLWTTYQPGYCVYIPL